MENKTKNRGQLWRLTAMVIMIGLFSSGIISLLLSYIYSHDLLRGLGLELISAGLIAAFLDVILTKDLLKIATKNTVEEIMPVIEGEIEKGVSDELNKLDNYKDTMSALIKDSTKIRYVEGLDEMYFELYRFLNDVSKTSKDFYIYGIGAVRDEFYGNKVDTWMESTRKALEKGVKIKRLQIIDCDPGWLKTLQKLEKDFPEQMEIRYTNPMILMPQILINPGHEVFLAPSETELKVIPMGIFITDIDVVHTFTVYFKEKFSISSKNVEDITKE